MLIKDLIQLMTDQNHKKSVVCATEIETGVTTLIYPEEDVNSGELVQLALEGLREDRSGLIQLSDQRKFFLHVRKPPLRLAIIGAAHIAQPLSNIAHISGYHVSIIDPRQAFAKPNRFPNADIIDDWPDNGLSSLMPDERCAVVALTHAPKLDDPGLLVAIRSTAFYVGALGSKTTHAKRLQRLRAEGIPEELLSRIHGPIGADIGAKSPAEIAISIMAEITYALRKAPLKMERR